MTTSGSRPQPSTPPSQTAIPTSNELPGYLSIDTPTASSIARMPNRSCGSTPRAALTCTDNPRNYPPSDHRLLPAVHPTGHMPSPTSPPTGFPSMPTPEPHHRDLSAPEAPATLMTLTHASQTMVGGGELGEVKEMKVRKRPPPLILHSPVHSLTSFSFAPPASVAGGEEQGEVEDIGVSREKPPLLMLHSPAHSLTSFPFTPPASVAGGEERGEVEEIGVSSEKPPLLLLHSPAHSLTSFPFTPPASPAPTTPITPLSLPSPSLPPASRPPAVIGLYARLLNFAKALFGFYYLSKCIGMGRKSSSHQKP
ncbi:hypothetical protein F4802DRAFT_577910 [Xylaria palmicola]|nr:hypothetical protein F4802DRAFT_577910 [Xylaria palmicola]